MNCDDIVFTREEMVEFAKNEAKRKQVEILNWALQVIGTAYSYGQIRKIIYNKVVEIEGKGEKA